MKTQEHTTRKNISLSLETQTRLDTLCEIFDLKESTLIALLLTIPAPKIAEHIPLGSAILETERKNRLDARRTMRDRLKKLTPEQLDKLLGDT